MPNEDASAQPPAGMDLSALTAEVLSPDRVNSVFERVQNLLNAAADGLERRTGAAPEKEPRTASGKGFLETVALIVRSALDRPEALASRLALFSSEALKILRAESSIEPDPADRRFKDPLWRESVVLRGLLQLYLAWGAHVQAWADAEPLDLGDRLRVKFLIDQAIAALSPANLPLNPAALRRAEASAGMSTVAGIKNFAEDLRTNRGLPRQILPGAYKLGVDLAATPGAVVLRTPVMELIQYAPQTASVRERGLLLVPPQINKYYAFDLRRKNSILGFLVREGLQTFTISWRNPDRQACAWGLDVYLRAVLDAIEAICSITGVESVNLVSACAGALTATALTGYLAEAQAPLVESHSMLVTALLPGNGSTLELFTTERSLEVARAISAREGVMDGKDLAHVFAWLRPNDLIWTYWVNNNILGRQPPPLDVLYWDNDSTRVPAKLHSDFIDMYLDDVFRRPGRHVALGRPVDYSKLRVDTYFVGGIDDYLMPWQGIYRVAKTFAGRHRFVLSTSGHVQSILRPPNLANTEHYFNPRLPASAARWLEGAEKRSGTWWFDWSNWLARKSGQCRRAPDRLGNGDFAPIAPAPGDYVHERIEPPG